MEIYLDYVEICQTFWDTVRIILNEFVFRMWYVVCRELRI